jgi:tetratricopeptide (TPR) repeat protein
MKVNRFIFLVVLLFSVLLEADTQTVINPYIGSKTHPSLSIDSIVLSVDETVIYLKIINKNTEGNAWFCADKAISLYELNSNREHSLIRSAGIPVCPDAHRFSYEGEILSFILFFPPLKDQTGELDLIEKCPDHCFSLKQIVLDNDLNRELKLFEEGVVLFQNNHFEAALKIFTEISRSAHKSENHYAYSMYIIPVIYWNLGDSKNARLAFSKLVDSDIPDKKYFIDKIREIPFFSEME